MGNNVVYLADHVLRELARLEKVAEMHKLQKIQELIRETTHLRQKCAMYGIAVGEEKYVLDMWRSNGEELKDALGVK